MTKTKEKSAKGTKPNPGYYIVKEYHNPADGVMISVPTKSLDSALKEYLSDSAKMLVQGSGIRIKQFRNGLVNIEETLTPVKGIKYGQICAEVNPNEQDTFLETYRTLAAALSAHPGIINGEIPIYRQIIVKKGKVSEYSER